LLRVDAPGGVTNYTYDSSGNPLQQNALTGIVNSDGSSQAFEYDSNGSLLSQAGFNGQGKIAYSYSAPGVVIETDAAGNTASLTYNAAGKIVRSEDALGNVANYQYNSFGRLSEVTTPTGDTISYT
jgi:YD repeat-containing protein